MSKRWKWLGMALGPIAPVLLATTGTAVAQVQPKSHEVHGYAGWLFGGDLTEKSVSGETPRLDDDFVGGLRYQYNFTKTWGLEVSLGYSPAAPPSLPGMTSTWT